MTVQGDLSLRSYVDKDGQNRTSLQIAANHVELPSRKNSVAANTPISADDELPI